MEEENYKEKQKAFATIYKFRGKSFWVSKEKNVSGKDVGVTYIKAKEEAKKLLEKDNNLSNNDNNISEDDKKEEVNE